MENIEDEIKKGKLVIKIQEIWSVANNIIGYSLIAAVIILGVQNGYRGRVLLGCGCLFLQQVHLLPVVHEQEAPRPF